MPPDWLLAPLDVAAIAALAWVGGAIAQRLRQPRIAGEMAAVFAAVLILGGRIAELAPGQHAEGALADLFPAPALALLTVVGGLGIALYMLLVGITIDPAPMRERAGAIVLLAGATIAAMLALALVAGPLLAAAGWKPTGVADSAFVLALTAALAANGVPIVARILEERATAHGAVGSIVIAAATLVTTLALLAAAVAIGGGDASAGARVTLRVCAGLAVLAAVLALLRAGSLSPRPAVAPFAVVAAAVASALAGEELLASLLIGPLVVGVAVDKRGVTALAVERRLGVAVRRVGLPAFLGLAALHTDPGDLDAGALTPMATMLVAVIASKLLAAYLAARAVGFRPADARAIGALMQCGGVMTIAVSLELLHAQLVDARMHVTLTAIGLASTITAGLLLPPAGRERRTRDPVRAAGSQAVVRPSP